MAVNDDDDGRRTDDQTDRHERIDGRTDIEIIMDDDVFSIGCL